MLKRFARFSLAISEIDRCRHKLAAEEMAKYDLNSPHAFYQYEEGIAAAKLGELCGKNKADVSGMVVASTAELTPEWNERWFMTDRG